MSSKKEEPHQHAPSSSATHSHAPPGASPSSAGAAAAGNQWGGPVRIGRFLQTNPMKSVEMQQWFDNHMRPNDVITNTLPKCGQTMLCTLLVSIKRKGYLNKNILAECPWIETITPTEVDGQLVKPTIEEHQKAIELLDEPRIFKQHVDWSEIATSTDPKIQSSIRYITITRDIRDVPYSMFEHLTGMTEDMSTKMRGSNMKIPDQFDAFFDWWINGPRFPTHFLKEFWDHRNDANVLVLKYEEATKNKEAAIKSIVKFLGWEMPSTDEMARIIESNTLESMQKMSDVLVGAKMMKPGKQFIREGKVGANRCKLNEEQLARLRAKCEATLAPEIVAYIYREDVPKLQ